MLTSQNIGMDIQIQDDVAKEIVSSIYNAFQKAGEDMPKHLNDAMCSLQAQIDDQEETCTPRIIPGEFTSYWEQGDVETAATINLDTMEVIAEEAEGCSEMEHFNYQEVVAGGKVYPVCDGCNEYAFKDKICPSCGHKQDPRSYQVDVSRIGYSNRTITVEACSQEEANELACDEAGGEDFSEHSSEYQVN